MEVKAAKRISGSLLENASHDEPAVLKWSSKGISRTAVACGLYSSFVHRDFCFQSALCVQPGPAERAASITKNFQNPAFRFGRH